MKKAKTKSKTDKVGGNKAVELSKISELYMGFETNEKEEVIENLECKKEEVCEKIELDKVEKSEELLHIEDVDNEKLESEAKEIYMKLEQVEEATDKELEREIDEFNGVTDNTEGLNDSETVQTNIGIETLELVVKTDQEEGTVDQKEVTADQVEVIVDQEEVTADQVEVTVDQEEVTKEQEEVTTDQVEVTTDQVERTNNKEMEEKIAVVTGANSGMGKATVAALADQGFTVIMLCRNLERGDLALRELTKKENRNLKLMQCNLGSMKDIRRFTDEFKASYNKIDVLVNNAGVISLDRRETEDGLEEQFGVNHLGHFLLTLRLLDLMSAGSRIVVVSSGAHKVGRIHFEDINLTQGFHVMKAYGQSKLANILFTRELAERLKGRGITVNCCHPGAVATSMGVDRNTGFGKTITSLLKPFFLTPEEGAKTAIFLATSPEIKNITGKYFYQCHMEKTSKAAKSKRLAKKLFALSEEITKEEMKYEI